MAANTEKTGTVTRQGLLSAVGRVPMPDSSAGEILDLLQTCGISDVEITLATKVVRPSFSSGDTPDEMTETVLRKLLDAHDLPFGAA